MTKKHWDALWVNGWVATGEKAVGLIPQGAVAVKDGKIAWVGSQQALPVSLDEAATVIHDMDGGGITPGLIDCHTHLVYAGNRANEFEQRLQGATYEEIAKGGGGIQSTVSATRQATEDELFAQSLVRAQALLANGVTTVEIKSGYGLDWATESKMLRVATRLEAALPLTVKKTFLGAHTVPMEYRGKADAYIDLVCDEMLPKIAAEKLADAVDVFCEKIAFSIAQTERVFAAAEKYHLGIKCHAEQLSASGSAKLAAQYHALSVDHLEHVLEEGVKAISESGTVAVLLPGAYYFLREATKPPIELLRQYQVPMAIATDCNPGTSPIMSPLLIMNMACTLFRLTPEEALLGVTYHAAKALGLEKICGTLTVNKEADLAIWKVKSPVELAYYMGNNPLKQLVKAGVLVNG